MARPFWSGHIQISLVSFGVQLFPATEAKSEIRFHQLNRKTGERVRYQKTSGDEAVDKSEIVKGYEYSKGQYVTVEPEEIENLRIPSRKTLEVSQFVDVDEVDPAYFEKPYFVVPDNSTQAEAFAVVRLALQKTKKIALGKIAFSGREHLVAIAAPSADEKAGGMMAYTMRYAEELRNPAEYFSDIKPVTVEEDQLSLAEELIKRKSGKFAPEKFKDEYEAALRAMVEAKVNHAPIPQEEPAAKSAKVVSLMDALRKSVQADEEPAAKKKPAARAAGGKSAAAAAKKGIALVKDGKARKSA
jgi:DNA end-binding protein Ku